jgi:NADPH:quinone reductase-like Zn-dependent oxidoreductase
MRAVVMTKHGPPETLRVEHVPDPPPPGAGEVTVGIASTGIAFSELMARIGVYPPAPKPPTVLGTDIAGTVVAVGDGVTGLTTGDRVFGVTRYGGYAERANTLADNVRLLPEQITLDQGAAVPINYGTAWLALVNYGGLEYRPESRVLVHAAAGGVGIAATQIAKRYGAEVWGTASASKHDAIAAIGVDHPIDYHDSGWERNLPKFDVILDPIGGPSWRTSYTMLRPGGRSINYGASSFAPKARRSVVSFITTAARMRRTNPLKQMWDSKAVVGLMMPALWDDRGTFGPFLDPLVGLIEDGTIAPIIDATFGFDQAPDAHRRLGERRNIGKVVLVSGANGGASSAS